MLKTPNSNDENIFWGEEWIRSTLYYRVPKRKRATVMSFFRAQYKETTLFDFLGTIRGEKLRDWGLMTVNLSEDRLCRIFIPSRVLDVRDTRFDSFIADLLKRPDLVAQIWRDNYPRELLSLLRRHAIDPYPAPARIVCRIEGEFGGKYETDIADQLDEEEQDVSYETAFLTSALWIAHDPETFLELVAGDIKAALEDYGISEERLTTALPLKLDEVLEDAAGLLPSRLAKSRRLAFDGLLYFGLQPFASIGTTVSSVLPEKISASYRRGERIYMTQTPYRACYDELIEHTQKLLKRWFAAVEATELDFETNERRAQTLWEEWLGEAANRQIESLTVVAAEDGNPYDCRFRLVLEPNEKERELEREGRDDADARTYEISAARFLAIVMTMPRWNAKNAPELVVLWRAVTRMAGKLLLAGALLPTPVWHDESLEVNYLWMPVLYLPEVRSRVSELASLLGGFVKELFPKESAPAGRYPQEKAALRALTLAASAIMRFALESKKTLARRETVERLVASSFGYTTSEEGSYHIQRNRFDSRYVYRDLHAVFFRTALSEELVVSVRNAGGGNAAVSIGFAAKKTHLADGRLTTIDVVAASARSYPKLSLVAGEALKSYAELFPIFKRYEKEFGKYSEERKKAHQAALGSKAASAAKKHRAPQPVAAPFEVVLGTAEIEDFLFNEAPRLSVAGIYVRLPQELSAMLEPKLVAVVDAGKTLDTKGLLDKYSLADFRWEAAVGDKRIPLEELRELINKAGHLVSYGDQFIYLTQAAAERIEAQMTAQKRVSSWDKLRAVLTGSWDGTVVEATAPVSERINALLAVKNLPPPAGLKAVLRPYQQRGFSWLMKNLKLGLGALIADDMGLGKTVQVIAAIEQLKADGELKDGRVLVVVPASVMRNWAREIDRFAPNLSVALYHGQSRSLPENDALPDVVLTSYRILTNDLEVLSSRKWRLLVLDEAQAIKNYTTAQATAARHFPAPQVIAMSGTPVENRLQEFWSIMAAVQPKLLGSLKGFRETYARPIEENRSELVLEQFRRLTKPFMIRRMKSEKDIISDLPERTTVDYFTSLTPEQTALYEECLKVSLSDLSEMLSEALEAGTVEEAVNKAALAATVELKRRGNILRMITHLKQIVNSPAQFQKTMCKTPDSGKGRALIELLSQCFDAERKVLVFTQFAEMGHLLVEWISEAFGRKPDFLHGGVSIEERQKMVDRFQNDVQSRVLVLSLKAGGLGLNLTAASAVIHYDLWWNPAVEAQANDRAYRIGQNRDVLVYRFITEGTFEEKLNQMISRKRELADITVSTGEAWIGDLSNREIEEIFKISR